MAARSPSLERVADHSALFGLAIAVGLLSGGIAVAFQWALARAAWLREGGARGAPTGDWKLPVAILFSALAVWAGVAVVRRFAPETSGSGIPQVEAALHRDVDVKWPQPVERSPDVWYTASVNEASTTVFAPRRPV